MVRLLERSATAAVPIVKTRLDYRSFPHSLTSLSLQWSLTVGSPPYSCFVPLHLRFTPYRPDNMSGTSSKPAPAATRDSASRAIFDFRNGSPASSAAPRSPRSRAAQLPVASRMATRSGSPATTPAKASEQTPKRYREHTPHFSDSYPCLPSHVRGLGGGALRVLYIWLLDLAAPAGCS